MDELLVIELDQDIERKDLTDDIDFNTDLSDVYDEVGLKEFLNETPKPD